ncbi:MAG: hypothetical protein IKO53_05295 [Lachnospiraceae bacterium]|nr:hypothetical protein [Lachnospiraceae bacterium]
MSLIGQIFGTSGQVQVPESVGNIRPAADGAGGSVLSDMTPGQTISGKVAGINGNTVEIDMGGGNTVSARLDQSINLKEGQNVTFEVRSGNQSQIALSPLYTNIAQGITAENALTAAGMSVNSDTLSMTLAMMNSGMSIDKNALGDMYHAVSQFPGSNIPNLVEMKALDIPINDANIASYEAFKNYENMVSEGIGDIAGSAMELYGELAAANEAEGFEFLHDLTNVITGSGSETQAVVAETADAAMNIAGENQGKTALLNEQVNDSASADAQGKVVIKSDSADVIKLTDGLTDDAAVIQNGKAVEGAESKAAVFSETADEISSWLKSGSKSADESAAVSETAAKNPQAEVQNAQSTENAASQLKNELVTLLKNNGAPESLINHVKDMPVDANGMLKLTDEFLKAYKEDPGLLDKGLLRADIKKLLSSPEFKNTVAEAMKGNLSLTPEQVSSKTEVMNLYNRLDAQVKDLTAMLNQIAKPESQMMMDLGQMNQNLDFMNQMNQTMQYIQLPLKMAGGEATGDLYVYSDKKSLARQDGTVSALLHLDMKYLGKMDIYTAINSANNVSTKFYLEDESMIDFIAEHIDTLNERLEKRGYSVRSELKTREDLKNTGGGERPMKDPTSSNTISLQSFDVRA